MSLRRTLLPLLLLALMASTAHAVTSNASGDWNTGATWVGGSKPADGEAVIIALGHEVVMNADLVGDGIDLTGLTITGTLTASTTAGDYSILCSADITGAGTWNIGTAETAYPNTCTFTVDFDGTASSIDCTAGLVLGFYCTNPTNTYVKLSAGEAINETTLSVDTDVTADEWAATDTVWICDVAGVYGQGQKPRYLRARLGGLHRN